MVIVIALFLAVGLLLIFSSTLMPFVINIANRAEVKLMRETHGSIWKKIRFFIPLAFPFSKQLLEKLKLDIKIKIKLNNAHVDLQPQEYFSLKIVLMAVLAATVIMLTRNKVDSFNIFMLIAGGYIIPDYFLGKKIRNRKDDIVRVLPETVDLLGLCVEAGLDFSTSVQWLIDKTTHNPMVEELAMVLEEIKWGKPRTLALKDMAKRLNVSEVNSLVQTLVQAEKMGTPVTQTFSLLSDDTRTQRYNRGERIALRAPILMLIPLIFCILPVIGIVVGAPIFLKFSSGGFFSGV